MRFLMMAGMLLLAATVLASTPELGAGAPAKATTVEPAPPTDPALIRQGGDTIADATPITLPHSGTGTTVGYTDDYDEVCPYDSTSPDVVYTFSVADDRTVDIDMYGSLYDTKIYVYDADLNLVDCNDDFYADYVSKLEGVELTAETVYYLVVDGYGGGAGQYVLSITDFEPCLLEIPAGATPEGEPPVTIDYVDCYNNGCGGECDTPFADDLQPLIGDGAGHLVFHGRSGWYPFVGSQYRETDWFVATFGPAGILDITVDAQWRLYLFELGPQDCASVTVVQYASCGPCEPATLTVSGAPGSVAWLWTGPQDFEAPGWLDPDGDSVAEFDYLLIIDGLQPGPVRTEARSWSGIKSLYE